jgi:hypothetical protein
MALAMHIQILLESRFSNSATDDELPKKHNEWPCIFQSSTTGAFARIGAGHAGRIP